ncbi:MAG: dihydrofolate reductase [Odoribacter sp.]|nr:dihydrofolate reductase [Odoribacter sp.]
MLVQPYNNLEITTMKILVTYDLPREAFKNIPANWEFTFPDNEKFSREELIKVLPDYEILVAVFNHKIDKEIIDAGKNLKLISNYGVGYDNIDVKYAKERNILVSNTPQSVCNPTAELCMSLLLSLSRRIAEIDRKIRIEKEALWGAMNNLGVGLEGKTLGIIGMGRIGKSVAQKAEAFGMKIIYHNRKHEVKGYERKELEDLLKDSDFISIHTPLTESTHHLLNKEKLSLLKESAFVINTSRGAVIDEKELTNFLKEKKIAGAALDVFEYEPHITEELYKMDNVVLTPHLGTATYEGRLAMAEEALNNIKCFEKGEPTNIVN